MRHLATFGRMKKPTRKQCQATLNDYKSQIVVEKVDNPREVVDHAVHYLAPHIVVKVGPDGKVKIRIVFDAKAQMPGHPSLNQCLHRGPVMLNDLLGLILRLRTSPIAVLTDVKSAFLQILLNENDRDVTRFLWPKNMDDLEEGFDVYRSCRLLFGLKPYGGARTVHTGNVPG